MLKWLIYYLIHLGANIAAVVLLLEHIQINAGSLAPVIIMAIMIFQALFAFNQSNDIGDTAFPAGGAERLSGKENNALYAHLKAAFFIVIPFCIPFVFFFSVYAKLISILLYFLTYVIGGVSFRLTHGKMISARLDAESEELTEQCKKEERGEA